MKELETWLEDRLPLLVVTCIIILAINILAGI